jgi:hypothetical protein
VATISAEIVRPFVVVMSAVATLCSCGCDRTGTDASRGSSATGKTAASTSVGFEGDPRPPIRPEELAELIDRADTVLVINVPFSDAILYQSSERRDLDALKAASRVVPTSAGYCMCFGEPAIELRAKGEVIGHFTNHHGDTLRYKRWNSDAPVADPEAFVRWFEERGIKGPRREWERSKVEQERMEVERRKMS